MFIHWQQEVCPGTKKSVSMKFNTYMHIKVNGQDSVGGSGNGGGAGDSNVNYDGDEEI